MDITLTELEAAINYWRLQRPSTGEECALSPEVGALAGVYAMMIFERRTSVPPAALDAAARQLIAASQAVQSGRPVRPDDSAAVVAAGMPGSSA